jgi:hypothetical protein
MHCLEVSKEGEKVTDGRRSLRDAADALGLDSLRLFRLGRYLHLAPGDKCLPAEVVDRASTEADGERRYRVVLDWLLASLQGPDSGTRSRCPMTPTR